MAGYSILKDREELAFLREKQRNEELQAREAMALERGAQEGFMAGEESGAAKIKKFADMENSFQRVQATPPGLPVDPEDEMNAINFMKFQDQMAQGQQGLGSVPIEEPRGEFTPEQIAQLENFDDDELLVAAEAITEKFDNEFQQGRPAEDIVQSLAQLPERAKQAVMGIKEAKKRMQMQEPGSEGSTNMNGINPLPGTAVDRIGSPITQRSQSILEETLNIGNQMP